MLGPCYLPLLCYACLCILIYFSVNLDVVVDVFIGHLGYQGLEEWLPPSHLYVAS